MTDLIIIALKVLVTTIVIVTMMTCTRNSVEGKINLYIYIYIIHNIYNIYNT